MIARIVRIASLILATTVGLAAAAWAQPRPPAACSDATFTGAYGITFGGIDSHGRLRTAVAQITTDGKGKFTGVESESKGGVILKGVPVTGTYAIKASCTGSGIWMANGKVRHYNLVLISGGGGAEWIQTDTGRTESGSAEAQGKATCSDAGVHGTFGFHATGSYVGAGPAAFIGQFHLNGGNIAGSESGSVNGTIFSGVGLLGKYTINSDCTGTAMVTPAGQSAVNFNLVVVDGGSKVLAVETDANSIVSGSLLK
jgi:hypothetical protein